MQVQKLNMHGDDYACRYKCTKKMPNRLDMLQNAKKLTKCMEGKDSSKTLLESLNKKN